MFTNTSASPLASRIASRSNRRADNDAELCELQARYFRKYGETVQSVASYRVIHAAFQADRNISLASVCAQYGI